MEGNRELMPRPVKPEVYLPISQFDFIKKMKIGDKGDIDFHGEISHESQSQSDDKRIIRRFRILRAMINKKARLI